MGRRARKARQRIANAEAGERLALFMASTSNARAKRFQLQLQQLARQVSIKNAKNLVMTRDNSNAAREAQLNLDNDEEKKKAKSKLSIRRRKLVLSAILAFFGIYTLIMVLHCHFQIPGLRRSEKFCHGYRAWRNRTAKVPLTTAGGYGEFNLVNKTLALPTKVPKDQIVRAYPDISCFELTKDFEFIVVACDGIWDVMTNEEVVKFCRHRLQKGMEPELIREKLLDTRLSPDCELNSLGRGNKTFALSLCLQGDDAETYLARVQRPKPGTEAVVEAEPKKEETATVEEKKEEESKESETTK